MNKDKPFFSVIVPVYNADKYIGKLIKSIINQTFSDFEVLLIDDGSTDGSAQICKSLAQEDSRINYTYQLNQGVAAARNKGLKYAKGKYLIFIDADDWIDAESFFDYSRYFNGRKELSLLIFGFRMEYLSLDKSLVFPVAPDTVYLNKKNFLEQFTTLLKKNLIATPWNKVYKTEIIKQNNLYFPNVPNEDIYFNMEYLNLVENVQLLDTTHYHWNKSTENSETSRVGHIDVIWKAKKNLFLKILEVTKEWNLGNKYSSEIYSYYTDRIIQIVQEVMKSDFLFNEKREYIKNILNDPLTIEAGKRVKATNLLMYVLFIPIKHKNILCVMFMGKLVAFFKENFSTHFLKIKSSIVNESKEVRSNV